MINFNNVSELYAVSYLYPEDHWVFVTYTDELQELTIELKHV